MLILTINHEFRYEVENLTRVFFPHEKIQVIEGVQPSENDGLEALIIREGCWQRYAVSVHIGARNEKAHRLNDFSGGKDAELFLCTLLFEVLCRFTGYQPPWGLLTGVRPAKLMGTLREQFGDQKAREYFIKTLRVSPEKTELAMQVSRNQDSVAASSHARCFSLYLSVPFCPSRCSYCSFVSHSIAQAKKLIPDYVALLCEELRATAKIASALGLSLRSVYMGGGTPTTLSESQLDEVLGTVRASFDFSECTEFTVEAGRPDTVTPGKLAVLRHNGVERISINPQTFHDDILCRIGRKHTCEDTLRAYDAAVRAGFSQINMDLIAGLPTDTPEGFMQSLEKTDSLSPSNITVHTLALKRSSELVSQEDYHEQTNTAAMLDAAQQVLTERGYIPYYMYRQSRSIGNLENVGWAKKGAECIYNIFMMEEIHTVLSCGAGAVTKCRQDGVNNIERIFNFKYPYEYIDRFSQILARKDKILDFYENPEKYDKTAD